MPNVVFTSDLAKRRLLEIQRLLKKEVMSINQLAVHMNLTTQIIQPYIQHLRDTEYIEVDRKEPAMFGAYRYFYRWGNKELDFEEPMVKIERKPKKEKAMRDPLVAAFFGVA